MPSALPIEKQIIWTVFWRDGETRDRIVGEKNMASSSGWAIRSAMLRLRIGEWVERWERV